MNCLDDTRILQLASQTMELVVKEATNGTRKVALQLLRHTQLLDTCKKIRGGAAWAAYWCTYMTEKECGAGSITPEQESSK